MKIHTVYLVIGLSLLLGGCWEKTPPDNSPIIAKVNDHTLTTNQLKQQIPAEYLETLGRMEKQAYLEQWINQQLLYQAAIEEDIHQDPKIKHRLQQFEEQLLADEILQRRLASAQISDEEAQKYYDENPEEFRREETEVKISHIVVSNEELARELRSRIQNGEDFSTIATEFSEDGTGMNGGDLGYFTESEATDELIRKAFELNVGQVSQPLKTPFGFHLITVTEKKEVGSTRSFETVKPDIVNNLVLEKQKALTDQLLENLEKEATIEAYPERLDLTQ